MAFHLERLVRQRIRLGDGQPPYSIRPAWYRIDSPRGAKGRFVKFLRQYHGHTIKSARTQRYAFMPRGYAQWRSIFKGRGFRRRPVNFELTGDMMKALRGRVHVKQRAVHARLDFKAKRKKYGNRITHDKLRTYLDARGRFPAFAIDRKEAIVISEGAIDIMLRM